MDALIKLNSTNRNHYQYPSIHIFNRILNYIWIKNAAFLDNLQQLVIYGIISIFHLNRGILIYLNPNYSHHQHHSVHQSFFLIGFQFYLQLIITLNENLSSVQNSVRKYCEACNSINIFMQLPRNLCIKEWSNMQQYNLINLLVYLWVDQGLSQYQSL